VLTKEATDSTSFSCPSYDTGAVNAYRLRPAAPAVTYTTPSVSGYAVPPIGSFLVTLPALMTSVRSYWWL